MRVKRDGRRVIDPLGGVFSPAPGASTPVWAYGPPGAKERTPLFTCPVSAIPAHVWTLFTLWQECDAMSALPYPGGVLEQPVAYREAATVFAQEQRALMMRLSMQGQALGTVGALGAVFGGKRR